MNLLNRLFAVALCGLTAATAFAADADKAAIRKSLAVLVPDAQPDSIQPTAVAGLYEVTLGAQVIYMTGDGRYLLQGSILDMEKRTSLTEDRRSQLRVQALEKTGVGNMIVFSPKKARHSVTVFTDIDCGYCRKLHSEINDYLNQGIEVRYVLYPRTGVDSPSYHKAVSVWCAKDRKDALTRAKAEQAVEEKTCDNPVQKGMALGEQFGIQGTPSIVTEDGKMLGGYVPAPRLAEILEGKNPQP